MVIKDSHGNIAFKADSFNTMVDIILMTNLNLSSEIAINDGKITVGSEVYTYE